jgi:DNA-binding CsgD family transcriptional regulator
MPMDTKLATRLTRTGLCVEPVALRDREKEALTWVARGKTSNEIAGIVGLSKRTVDFHVDNARAKLDAATRSQAVIEAIARGLIAP